MKAEPFPPKGWTFEVVEISNGGWECRGLDSEGRLVSRQGSDPDGLIRMCWKAAHWVNEDPDRASDIRQR